MCAAVAYWLQGGKSTRAVGVIVFSPGRDMGQARMALENAEAFLYDMMT